VVLARLELGSSSEPTALSGASGAARRCTRQAVAESSSSPSEHPWLKLAMRGSAAPGVPSSSTWIWPSAGSLAGADARQSGSSTALWGELARLSTSDAQTAEKALAARATPEMTPEMGRSGDDRPLTPTAMRLGSSMLGKAVRKNVSGANGPTGMGDADSVGETLGTDGARRAAI